MSAFQAKKLFDNEIKVPDKCPICGSDIIKNSGSVYPGCHLCAPQLEAPSDSFASSLLDISASITQTFQKPQRTSRSRKRRTRISAQPLFKEIGVINEKRVEFFRPFVTAFVMATVGAALGLILCLSNLQMMIPPFTSAITYTGESVKLINVNYSKNTGFLKFDVLNDGALPIEDFKLTVGLFDQAGDLVNLVTVNGKSAALGSRSRRAMLSTEALLQPLEQKTFQIKLDEKPEKISIVPVYVKFVM